MPSATTCGQSHFKTERGSSGLQRPQGPWPPLSLPKTHTSTHKYTQTHTDTHAHTERGGKRPAFVEEIGEGGSPLLLWLVGGRHPHTHTLCAWRYPSKCGEIMQGPEARRPHLVLVPGLLGRLQSRAAEAALAALAHGRVGEVPARRRRAGGGSASQRVVQQWDREMRCRQRIAASGPARLTRARTHTHTRAHTHTNTRTHTHTHTHTQLHALIGSRPPAASKPRLQANVVGRVPAVCGAQLGAKVDAA